MDNEVKSTYVPWEILAEMSSTISQATWTCKFCDAQYSFKVGDVQVYVSSRQEFSDHLVKSHPEYMALAVLRHG